MYTGMGVYPKGGLGEKSPTFWKWGWRIGYLGYIFLIHSC